jgi:hypothetical protein
MLRILTSIRLLTTQIPGVFRTLKPSVHYIRFDINVPLEFSQFIVVRS